METCSIIYIKDNTNQRHTHCEWRTVQKKFHKRDYHLLLIVWTVDCSLKGINSIGFSIQIDMSFEIFKNKMILA